MRVLKLTMTYLQHIQLAPYTNVDAGMVVEVEPSADDGPEAVRDLAALIAETWAAIGPATQTQVQITVEAFDTLQAERRLRNDPTRPSGGTGGTGAAHAPTAPEPATPKQRETITKVAEALGWSLADLEAFAARLPVVLDTMTRGEAHGLITVLHQQPPKRRPDPPAGPPEPQPEPEPQAAPELEPQAAPEPEPQAASVEPTEPPAAPAPPPPPATPEEAERRFYQRYRKHIGGTGIAVIRTFLESPQYPKPTTIEAWITTAERVRDRVRELAAAAAAA